NRWRRIGGPPGVSQLSDRRPSAAATQLVQQGGGQAGGLQQAARVDQRQLPPPRGRQRPPEGRAGGDHLLAGEQQEALGVPPVHAPVQPQPLSQRADGQEAASPEQ